MVTVRRRKYMNEQVALYHMSYIDRRGCLRGYEVGYCIGPDWMAPVTMLEFYGFVLESLMSTGLKFIQTRGYAKLWLP